MSGDSFLSCFAEGCAVSCFEDSTLYCYGGLNPASTSQTVGSNEDSLENAIPSRTLKEVHLGSTPRVCDLTKAPCATVFSTLASTDDKLYLMFGFSREEGWSDEVYVYDKDSKSWTLLDTDSESDSPGPRDKHCSVLVGKQIYIFGGFGPMSREEIEVYDQLYGIEEEEEEEEGEKKSSGATEPGKTETSVTEGTAANEREEAGNSKEKTQGHRNGHSQLDKAAEKEESDEDDEDAGPSISFSWYNDIWILDTSSQGKASWVQPLYTASARPTPRAASSLCYDPKRKWLVNFGGRDHAGRRNDVNIFYTEERKWMLDVAEGGPTPPERSYHAACIHKDQMIIVGGRDNTDKELNDIFIFDLGSFHFKSVSLSEKIPLAPRSCHFITVLDGKLFVSGGVTGFDSELMHCRTPVLEHVTIPLADVIEDEGPSDAKKMRLDEEKKE